MCLRICNFVIVALALLVVSGCTSNATLFSETFRSYTEGNVVPLAPGEASGFVLVRLVNETPNAIEFLVTAQRQTLIVDDLGNQVIETANETVSLRTLALANASEVGALFDCPVTRIGLGEDLDNFLTDPGLLVYESAANSSTGVEQGFGVPANIPPVDSLAGNFGCGDTIIFRAIESRGSVGNIQVQSFILPWQSQPTEFSGPHTFNNVRLFLEGQIPEEE